MLWQLKLVGIVFGGVVALASSIMLYQTIDIKMNYSLVEAEIISVKTDCFIEEGKREIVDEETNKRAYMDCSIASHSARQHGFGQQDIQKRAKVEYRYKSPVNSRTYTGLLTREREVENLVSGRTIYVHAHNTEPRSSRTSKGNFFLEDTGV